MPFTFLSDEWIDAVVALGEEYRDRLPAPDLEMSLNLVVTDSPFGEDPLTLYVDNSAGVTVVTKGHRDGADATVTGSYELARSLFAGGDPSSVQRAMLNGDISVQGDVAKLMAAQIAAATRRTDLDEEIAARLQALTVV